MLKPFESQKGDLVGMPGSSKVCHLKKEAAMPEEAISASAKAVVHPESFITSLNVSKGPFLCVNHRA